MGYVEAKTLRVPALGDRNRSQKGVKPMADSIVDWLSEDEVAKILRISNNTLRIYRSSDWGPPWFSLGRKLVCYDREEFRIWLQTRKDHASQI